MEEENPQFVPFAIHIAQSDAAWLAAWAPDPRALGAHAMGLAALRGLLAEDMPKDGQPLGGEIQHARAVIANARASDGEAMPPLDPFHSDTAADFMRRRVAQIEETLDGMASGLAQRVTTLEKARARDGYRLETSFTYVENLERRIAALETQQTETALRLNAATTAGATFRKRVAALLAAIYRPQAGDEVDIIDRATDEIITTETVQYVAADGPAVGNHDEDTDFIHRADPHRYILPHVEA